MYDQQSVACPRVASVALARTASAEDCATIYRGLDEETAPYAGLIQVHPLVVLLRDADGIVVGGFWGRTAYAWLTIEMLFVPEAMRGHGLGTALVRMAETEARSRGCIAVRVESFDFQAPAFYRRLGYTVFGVLADHPPGYNSVSLSKRLTP